ncbi:hypothetical protein MRY87_09210 [bacterium]|nr:hypothetical protein [bacterium]
MSRVPSSYEQLYSKEAIATRVRELGVEIDAWIDGGQGEGDRDVLALPVLRGGLYFFADLSRAISNSLEVHPIQSWAYNGEENTALPSGVAVKMSDLPVRGRRVLIVDDICDSGRTLEAIHKSLLERGAREVCASVLVQRIGSEPNFRPRWTGFQYDGPEWFVGYGMDDGGRWRNLSDIFLVR